jgi:hypothetical protein
VLGNAGKIITMKNYLRSIFCCLLLVVLSSTWMIAQRRTPNVNIGFQLAQPLGDFVSKYNGYPAGFGGTLSIPIMHLPIEWGIGYAWNSMGSTDKDILALINQDSINGNKYSNGKLAIRSNSSRYAVHARFRPLKGRYQPYADVFSGLETFKTTTTITVDNSGYSTELSTNRDHLDMTFFYGWALGMRVRLAPSVYAEARYESIIGGQVQFVDDNTIELNDDNSISFDLKESHTNKAVYQLGVAFTF